MIDTASGTGCALRIEVPGSSANGLPIGCRLAGGWSLSRLVDDADDRLTTVADGRMGLLPGRLTLLRIGAPMGAESLVGAAAGGAFAGSTSAEVLKLLLGLILVAAAFKAFWRRV
jgi:hypothetical protein